MTNTIQQAYPAAYAAIEAATRAAGFTMASDVLTCALLRTLAASKPGGQFLELGTGTGLSTAWLLDGMSQQASLVSVDHDPQFLAVAEQHLSHDKRLKLVCADAGLWLQEHRQQIYDFIFADTWHGKYLLLEETLAMLKPGGIYFIDDMLPQPNWPEGHAQKALQLLATLERRNDLLVTQQHWATGIVLGVKK